MSPYPLLSVLALLVPLQEESETEAPVSVNIQLSEVAAKSGLDHVSLSGEPTKPRLPDQLGQGMAWFDYDGDGWLDLFVVNGANLAHWQGLETNKSIDHLYRNKGDGTFEDVTEESGLGSNRWGAGVAVGDIDQDGDPDLYVCNFGKNQVWRNNGDGTFSDITESAGAEFDAMTPGAALGDVDLDGDLDLYVAHYVHFDPQDPPSPFSKSVRDMMVAPGPQAHRAAPDKIFRNDGKGVFEDVSKEWGLIKDRGCGFTALIVDMTGDDIPDIFVTCDESRNLFYMGQGGGRLQERSSSAGLDLGGNGKVDGCMGVALGDMNEDALPDLYITNFFGERNALYVSLDPGLWDHRTDRMERYARSGPYVGWGTGFFDLDLDGDEDVLMVNGHIHPQLNEEEPLFTTYEEHPLLFRTERRFQFTEIHDLVGAEFAEKHSARGAAFADYDEDGDMDLAVTDVDGPIRLFRNDTKTDHHFLKVALEGTGDINRDGYGAQVTVLTRRKARRRWITGQGSYLCQNDARAHFGLGTSRQVKEIIVRWPGGKEEVIAGPIAVDQTVVIRAGEGVVARIPAGQPMPGWRDRRDAASPPESTEPDRRLP